MTEARTADIGSISPFAPIARSVGWALLAVMVAFLANNVLTHWAGLPGPALPLDDAVSPVGLFQSSLYPITVIICFIYVFMTKNRTLRFDGERIAAINTFFIRAAFWAVLVVGSVDGVVAFLRIEGLLEGFLGEALADNLGRSQFRGVYLHSPLICLGIVLAALTRTLGFQWLALLIVVAELGIVFLRFVFSYEQAFMADLVRFWYGALFLFASAYTLKEEGHVRVDVFYAGFRDSTRALVNAVGSLLMGIPFCWTILIVGMGQKSAIINSPILNFEVTQAGFGLYVKYMMAGFLGIFAISMMIQFVSAMLESVADYLDAPGRRPASAGA